MIQGERMGIVLKLAFLFFIGSVLGWMLELLFRRFISSANPERKWINPGFCTGPYLPLYGCGLCLMYLISLIESQHIIGNPVWNRICMFVFMAVTMTTIEYIVGIIGLKRTKVRLWDYSSEWGNIQGVICPKFSLAWAVLGIIYFYLVHPHILAALTWLSQNLAFSFVIGLFFGVFIVDVIQSARLVSKLKQFAEENNVIVRYEVLKENIRSRRETAKQKYSFFRPFHTDIPLTDHLHELKTSFERGRRKLR